MKNLKFELTSENLPSPLFALRARGPMGRRPKRGNSSLWKREVRRDFTNGFRSYFEELMGRMVIGK